MANETIELTSEQAIPLASQPADSVTVTDSWESLPADLLANPARNLSYVGTGTKLTSELAREILSRTIDGEAPYQYAKELGIGSGRVYDWVERYPKFGECFMRARKICAHSRIDRAICKLEDNSQDLYNDGKRIAVNTAQVQRDFRLAEMLKFWAGRYNPLYAEQPQTLVQVNQFVDQPASETRDDWLKRKAKEQAKQTVIVSSSRE